VTVRSYRIADLQTCFAGVVPAVLGTRSAAGVPNVTYVSRVHPVDDERIAVSNQFLTKSRRNLAEDPHASLILVRPDTMEEFRFEIVFEQTLRKGPVFDRLRNDLSMVAALTGMQDVFRLQAADIFRVDSIERIELSDRVSDQPLRSADHIRPQHAALGELCARLSRCGDLDTLVRVTVDGLAELLGYEHSLLLLADERGEALFTIGSHGYDSEGVGSEVRIGDGIAGLAAARCEPMSARNLVQMQKYATSVESGFAAASGIAPGRDIPMPGLALPRSQVAVPALALGELVGAILIESDQPDRFGEDDVAALIVVASLVAGLVDRVRTEVAASPVTTASAAPVAAAHEAARATERRARVRYFRADGSTFIDDDYLTKGVAGRILWSLLGHHQREGRTEFTNREVRLDPTLDLPDFRDNFESRLILLKRRLDERDAPVRIERTGRGRFRLIVAATIELDLVDAR
jgi:predicted pyridoxine 5'-phosphate oxidase superfamily flavin-nucleotide-binding protein